MAEVLFSADERAAILNHGPWPPPLSLDKSNRLSGNQQAIAWGQALFNDPRLSRNGTISCASCHRPEKDFSDEHPLAIGRETGHRNTPTVINTRFNRWFGWGGAIDTLWGASIRPILSPLEMNAGADIVSSLLHKDPKYRSNIERLGAKSPPAKDILVIVGKSLAAYQETLVSEKSIFDHFYDGLTTNNREAIAKYPESAKRGLKIFVGKGRCNLCHFGPLFTNGEFGDAGIPYFTKNGGVDKGRYGGIKKLRQSPYRRSGSHSDQDKTKKSQHLSRFVKLRHRNWGEFKVPSLRGVSKTAPYMHNGSLPSLESVVNHYSNLNEERLHTDGEAILRPLNLTSDDAQDLVAFLRTL